MKSQKGVMVLDALRRSKRISLSVQSQNLRPRVAAETEGLLEFGGMQPLYVQ